MLLWLGDDQWAYQKVGRENKTYLLKQPMTEDDLGALLSQAEDEVSSVQTGTSGGEPASREDERKPITRKLIPLLLALFVIGFLALVGVAVYEAGILQSLFFGAKPVVSAQAKAYGEDISPKLNAITEALDELAYLLKNPRPGDQEWQLDVARQTVFVRLTHVVIQTLVEVPSGMEQVHREILVVSGDCDESAQHLSQWQESGNADDLKRSSELMEDCTRGIRRFRDRHSEFLSP